MKTALIVAIISAATLALTGCPGPKGDAGNSGAPGAQGPAGQTGAQGPSGAPGTDITEITWVQFCPGTTSYPSNFQEGGLCFGGNVYGVYSANDGFLTELPPGTYSSNAIGNSCTFTLLPNCVIQ